MMIHYDFIHILGRGVSPQSVDLLPRCTLKKTVEPVSPEACLPKNVWNVPLKENNTQTDREHQKPLKKRSQTHSGSFQQKRNSTQRFPGINVMGKAVRKPETSRLPVLCSFHTFLAIRTSWWTTLCGLGPKLRIATVVSTFTTKKIMYQLFNYIQLHTTPHFIHRINSEGFFYMAWVNTKISVVIHRKTTTWSVKPRLTG